MLSVEQFLSVEFIFLWNQPLSRQVSDARGICGRWAEVKDGGEDALVVFYANILAMTNSRVVTTAETCGLANLIAGDVQAVTFGFEYSTELLIPLTKIHCFDDL